MSQFEARAHLKIRAGQLEGFKRQAAEMMRLTREKDTGTLAYDWLLSKDGTECEVHEAYVDADALVEHALNVREDRAAMLAESACRRKMAFYGDPSPRLAELVGKVGVDATRFTLLQALERESVHWVGRRAPELTGGTSRSVTAHVGYPDGRLIAGAIRRRHASRPKTV